MTPQQIFDTVTTHVLGMTHRSADGGTCRYRMEDGNRCAVGCLLTDGQATSFDRLQLKTVEYLARNRLLPDDLTPHAALLQKLQAVHDNRANWSPLGPPYHNQMIMAFERIAKAHNLCLTSRNQCKPAMGDLLESCVRI